MPGSIQLIRLQKAGLHGVRPIRLFYLVMATISPLNRSGKVNCVLLSLNPSDADSTGTQGEKG